MKNILAYALFSAVLFIYSCDKIESPYGQGLPVQTNSVTIDQGTITGSIIDYNVLSATESDTSILYATWTYQENADTSYASVIFTWNGIQSDSLTGIATPLSPVHFDDTLSIAAGSPYGTLVFHYIADIGANGNGEATVMVFIANQATARKVLLVDFTGQQCIYCPRGARQAAVLEGLYGDQLVCVAIHAGSFAIPNGSGMYSYDFRTTEGTQWATALGVNSYPNGSVNFKSINGSPLQLSTAWGSSVANLLALAPEANIEVVNTFDATSRQLITSVNTTFLTSLAGDYNLAVFLTEDSIINWQKDIDATPYDNPNYVHMHTLRTSFSGAFGENIASSPAASFSVQKQYSITLASAYKEKDCHVVAFVFKNTPSDKEVVQAEKQPVIQ
jgi:hypothetical protein